MRITFDLPLRCLRSACKPRLSTRIGPRRNTPTLPMGWMGIVEKTMRRTTDPS